MKTKKFILSLLLGSLLIFWSTVYAESTDELLVESQKIPESADNYARETFGRFLNATIYNENMQSNIETSLADYRLGSSFKMIDGENNENGTILFPVIYNETIECVFFVRKTDGIYSGTLSKFLASELQKIKKESVTDEEHPITFFEKNKDIYFEQNNIVTKIFTSPDRPDIEEDVSSEILSNEKNDFKNLEQINALDNTNFIITEVGNNVPNKRSTHSDKFGVRINWTVNEVQNSNPWCAAYSAANILNNKNDKRPTTAAQIASWAGRSSNQAITRLDLIRYANSRGVYPREAGVLTWNQVTTEVMKSNAIYGGWAGAGKVYAGSSHAINIVGTYSESGFKGYWISNPWYKTIDLVTANSKVVSGVPGGSFTWVNSITNW
ncbi:hypothetical protein CYV25_01745 [Carnobacterium maltaromaticum]|uniref:staphopain proregion domain-containing protein n=1 Tax=Carnobacterium maltaromaticum TaxID=2751 RepID=UPI000C75B488|nr:staphopain proregion domain-containing protein [Carnobacterium maltaromaticum]PLS38306.1 hypothetical protein CYV33_03710 [Carnobacterium maltaromaticum]PLS38683.1 hypothetical protein CYV31_06235 [Carnobacterium maltaromaticum]PLS39060.1 hypothetical protein CYV30_03705 [Carnobacterium maltaromaticum]PLS45330.1 hypothetical protein CYV28_03705 [Carnobacterium maltaromaticum]PLS48185.1 hypothetical protein CYV27_01745 [Carnobacterium maltaromaticum]